MSIEPDELQSRLRVHLEQQGAVLTDAELSHLAETYPRFLGKEHWDVREYARVKGAGAREYRVVRGSSPQDVYCSNERVLAAAVQTALNELEAGSGDVPGAPTL
jgi:hypothetical protein